MARSARAATSNRSQNSIAPSTRCSPRSRGWTEHDTEAVWWLLMADSHLVHQLTERYMLDHHLASQSAQLYDLAAQTGLRRACRSLRALWTPRPRRPALRSASRVRCWSWNPSPTAGPRTPRLLRRLFSET